jgi:hypothetical protein
MKQGLFLALVVCAISTLAAAQVGIYQHGTVVRMRMGECAFSHRGFVSMMGGGPVVQQPEDDCPEYTLVSDKVVFVIVGKSSNELIPLAEVNDFRFHKNELEVRVDDARKESKFTIKEMMLRTQWDLVQAHIEEQLSASRRGLDGMDAAVAMRSER